MAEGVKQLADFLAPPAVPRPNVGDQPYIERKRKELRARFDAGEPLLPEEMSAMVGAQPIRSTAGEIVPRVVSGGAKTIASVPQRVGAMQTGFDLSMRENLAQVERARKRMLDNPKFQALPEAARSAEIAKFDEKRDYFLRQLRDSGNVAEGATVEDLIKPPVTNRQSEIRQEFGQPPAKAPVTDPRDRKVSKLGDQIIQMAQGVAGRPDIVRDQDFIPQLSEGGGQYAPMIVGGVLGGIAAPLVLGSSQMGVAQLEDALEHGAPLNDALLAGNLSAVLGLSEALPVARLPGMGAAGARRLGFTALTKVPGGSRIVMEIAKGAGEEGLQEFFQTIGENLIASDVVGYDKDRDTMEGAARAATIGAILGGSAGGVMSGVQAMSEKYGIGIPEEIRVALEQQDTINRIEAAEEARRSLDPNRAAQAQQNEAIKDIVGYGRPTEVSPEEAARAQEAAVQAAQTDMAPPSDKDDEDKPAQPQEAPQPAQEPTQEPEPATAAAEAPTEAPKPQPRPEMSEAATRPTADEDAFPVAGAELDPDTDQPVDPAQQVFINRETGEVRPYGQEPKTTATPAKKAESTHSIRMRQEMGDDSGPAETQTPPAETEGVASSTKNTEPAAPSEVATVAQDGQQEQDPRVEAFVRDYESGQIEEDVLDEFDDDDIVAIGQRLNVPDSDPDAIRARLAERAGEDFGGGEALTERDPEAAAEREEDFTRWAKTPEAQNAGDPDTALARLSKQPKSAIRRIAREFTGRPIPRGADPAQLAREALGSPEQAQRLNYLIDRDTEANPRSKGAKGKTAPASVDKLAEGIRAGNADAVQRAARTPGQGGLSAADAKKLAKAVTGKSYSRKSDAIEALGRHVRNRGQQAETARPAPDADAVAKIADALNISEEEAARIVEAQQKPAAETEAQPDPKEARRAEAKRRLAEKAKRDAAEREEARRELKLKDQKGKGKVAATKGVPGFITRAIQRFHAQAPSNAEIMIVSGADLDSAPGWARDAVERGIAKYDASLKERVDSGDPVAEIAKQIADATRAYVHGPEATIDERAAKRRAEVESAVTDFRALSVKEKIAVAKELTGATHRSGKSAENAVVGWATHRVAATYSLSKIQHDARRLAKSPDGVRAFVTEVSPGRYVIYLPQDFGRHPRMRQMEYALHELGHIYEMEIFENAPAKVQQKLRAQWKRANIQSNRDALERGWPVKIRQELWTKFRESGAAETEAAPKSDTTAIEQEWISRFEDHYKLDPEDPGIKTYPQMVEEFLSDQRIPLKAKKQIIMKLTGVRRGAVGNADNRRIALISWRRMKASDDYLFRSRANEKRRFAKGPEGAPLLDEAADAYGMRQGAGDDALAFSEWFANQISRTLSTSDTAIRAVEAETGRWWKRLASMWRKLANYLRGMRGPNGERYSNEHVEAWLNEVGIDTRLSKAREGDGMKATVVPPAQTEFTPRRTAAQEAQIEEDRARTDFGRMSREERAATRGAYAKAPSSIDVRDPAAALSRLEKEPKRRQQQIVRELAGDGVKLPRDAAGRVAWAREQVTGADQAIDLNRAIDAVLGVETEAAPQEDMSAVRDDYQPSALKRMDIIKLRDLNKKARNSDEYRNVREEIETRRRRKADELKASGDFTAEQLAETLSVPVSEAMAEVKADKRAAEMREQGTAEREDTPQTRVTDAVSEHVIGALTSGQKLNGKAIMSVARDAGGPLSNGDYSVSDVYNGVELGFQMYVSLKYISGGFNAWKSNVNTEGSVIGSIKGRIAEVAEAEALLPTQNRRGSKTDAFQQFSTPPAYAYAVNTLAMINPGDSVLEPSAGNGGIAIWAAASDGRVTVNEIDPDRRDSLDALREIDAFQEVMAEDGEQIGNLMPGKFDRVVMNPPFSAAGKRGVKNTSAIGGRHVDQALQALKPGGRLVAIVGHTFTPGNKRLASFWKRIEKGHQIRAMVRVKGDKIYRKMGTTYDTVVIVIDKTGAPNDRSQTVTASVDTLEDLIDVTAEIRTVLPARDAGGADASESGRRPDRDRDGTKPQRPPRRGQRGARVSGDNVDAGPVQGSGRGSLRNDEAQDGSENSGGLPGVAEERGEVVRGQPRTQPTQLETESREGAKRDAQGSFTGYAPSRVMVKGAKPHPAKLVESNAMASVSMPPTEYRPTLSAEDLDNLSEAQLENVIYAGAAHSETLESGKRKGYFIGDGTGVGKGREIAGVILDNANQGRRRAVWVSKNQALFNDAKRDLDDVGVGLEVVDGREAKGYLGDMSEGVFYTTYDGLKAKGTAKTRIEGEEFPHIARLVRMLGKDFDGVIAFDEAHMMANAVTSKGERGEKKASAKARAGLALQDALPNARILYVSATGATEVSNLGYLDRLGLWGEGTAFSTRNEFLSQIDQGGVAAMELVARDLKQLGSYLARSISYDGVEYEPLVHPLTADQRDTYNTAAQAWTTVSNHIDEAIEVLMPGADKSDQQFIRGKLSSQFWGAHQRFFSTVLTSMQMPSVLNQIQEDLDNGLAPVIQLTNTGAAAQKKALGKLQEGDTLEDLDVTPRRTIMELVESAFPVHQMEQTINENGDPIWAIARDGNGDIILNQEAVAMRDALLDDLARMNMPDAPLDMILDQFGVENVAEITGRTTRVARVDGKRVQQSRSAKVRDQEAKDFADGKRGILVFSEAGGTGQSYHAGRGFKNQKRRAHYILQAGWKADSAVQGFGRTHRSNQASAPIYRLVQTDLAGHKRFVSTIARRLDQLGALTKGQRDTSSSGLFSATDNLESAQAANALQTLLRDIRLEDDSAPMTREEFEDASMLKLTEKQDITVSKFLNRLMAMPTDVQDTIFDAFVERLEEETERARQAGELDAGLETVKAESVSIEEDAVIHTDEKSQAETRYLKMKLEVETTPVPYDMVAGRPDVQFWSGDEGTVATVPAPPRTNQFGQVIERVRVIGPLKTDNTYMTRDEWTEKQAGYQPIDGADTRDAWEAAVEAAPKTRTVTKHMLTGALLPVYDRLPRGKKSKVERVVMNDGTSYLGRILGMRDVKPVLKRFNYEAGKGASEGPQASQVMAAVKQGASVYLNEGVRIREARVGGEKRVEVVDRFMRAQYDRRLQAERIDYKMRVFVPETTEGALAIREMIERQGIDRVEAKSGEEVELSDFGGRTFFAKAPLLGKSTDPNSREFQEWFEGSEYRFSDGSPRPLYHGSQSLLRIRRMRAGKSKRGNLGKGISLTAIKDDARYYARGENEEAEQSGQVVTVYASIKNPLRVRHADEVQGKLGLGLEEYQESSSGDGSLITERAKALGYDGIDMNRGEVVVAFGDDQVRVVKNEGRTFFAKAPSSKPRLKAEDGSDLVVYHGTDVDFSTFDGLSHFGTERAARDRLEHIGATEGSRRLGSYYLRAEKPLRLDDLGEWLVEDIAEDLSRKGIISEEENRAIIRGDINIDDADAFMIDKIKEAGFDVIVYQNQTEDRGSDSYIVLDGSSVEPITRTLFALAPVRTQLRTGPAAGTGTAQPNAATYQALNQRNYQTLIGGPGGQTRNPRELLTRFDRFRSNYQDAFIAPMRVMQEAQRRRGRHLEDYENVYLQEKTYAGRVGDKMSEVQFELVEPAIEAMAETGLTMEQLDEYLAAKHAPERNAQIARINPQMPDGGSGMTTADANAITARYESGDHAPTVRLINRLIRRMRVRAIRWRVEAGLMNAEQAKRWLKAYRHYVPLKGWDDISNAPIDEEVKRQYGGEANQPIGGGKSFTIKGGESRRALGRGAGNEAANPFVQFITDVEEAIVRGEKNRILQSVLQLARAGDMNDFVEEITVRNIRVYNPSTGLVETQARNPLLAAEEANHVTVKEDGQERRIRFNDAELAKAFKQTGNVQLQGAMRVAQAYSMYFSQVTTSYNPAFLFVNMARDIGAFTVTAPRFRVPGMRRQMARHYFSGNAFLAAYRGLQGNYRGEWGRWFKDFQRAGGKISFFDIGGVESKAGQYRRRIRARQGDMTLGDYDLLRNVRGVRSVNVSGLHRVANIAADNIELVNLAADNALRISVFRAAVESGVSEQEAAAMARDVTVDFNKKGFRSAYVNALFTFTNAGVQGTETLLRAVARSRAVQANIGLLVLAGFAQELANGFLGEEDDDEQLPYDKINDYTLEHNIVIMAGGEPITIPLQYGINVPYNLGRIIGRSVRAGMGANIDWSAGKAVKSIFGTVAEAVFPLYESVGDSGPLNRDSVIKTMSPTITDPLVELATNKTFTGGKVRPDNPFDRSPESQQYFNNVSEGSKIAANAIGAATGGSKYEAGGIDTSPENIDHIMTELAGGGGAFLLRLVNLAEKAIGGKIDTVENYDIPIARRFRPEVGIHADRSLAYDRAGEALGAFDSVKSALLDQYEAGKLEGATVPITDDMLTNRGRFKVGAVRDYISVATEAQIRQLGMTPGAVQQIKDGVDYNDARRLYDTIGSRLAKLYKAGRVKEMRIPIKLTDSGNLPAKAARAWLRSASAEDAEAIGLSRRAYHAAQFDKRAKGVYDALAAFRRQRVKAEELPNEERKRRVKEIDAEEQKVLDEWNRVFLRAILRGEAAPEPIEDEAKAG